MLKQKKRSPHILLSGQMDKDLKVGDKNISPESKIKYFLLIYLNLILRHL